MVHPYSGLPISFATMHGKEKVLGEMFQSQLGARLIVPSQLDTDKYGTFSGEVSRLNDIRSVLREKAREGARLLDAERGLASEGTFGPHPWIPLTGCNQESLLFIDLKRDIEIFAHVISMENRSECKEVESEQDVLQFCKRVTCGSQAVVVKPSHDFSESSWIFKGLTEQDHVLQAFQKLQKQFPSQKLWIETDNRAHLNPKRRKVIHEVGEKLMEALLSLCPDCRTPGFQMSGFERGLTCSGCGLKSDKAAKEIWTCPSKTCLYQELRGRLDGRLSLDPSECDWCNP